VAHTDLDPTTDASAVFSSSAGWRADVVADLPLTDEGRAAALAAGPGFPAALRSIVAAMGLAACDTVVDLGAGVGGASAWVMASTGAQVIAVEPEPDARRAARELFPELTVTDGRGDSIGMPDDSVDGVMALGLFSLLDELWPTVLETKRLLRPGRCIGVIDLFATSTHVHREGPNTFRSIPRVLNTLGDAGFEVVDVGCGSVTPPNEWQALSTAIDLLVRERYRDDPAFAAWDSDQQHLGRMIEDGTVMCGSLVAKLRDEQ
jgi:SAM-dependent methyltransferase